jgi:hypothetical protein
MFFSDVLFVTTLHAENRGVGGGGVFFLSPPPPPPPPPHSSTAGLPEQLLLFYHEGGLFITQVFHVTQPSDLLCDGG